MSHPSSLVTKHLSKIISSLFFRSEIQNFENCTQTANQYLTKKYKIFKIVPKWSFVYPAYSKTTNVVITIENIA